MSESSLLEAIAGGDRLPLDTTALAGLLDPRGSYHPVAASSVVRASSHLPFP